MRDTRKRYVSWGGMVNMQSGLPGDIDPTSFVSVHVLGSEEAANRVQSELLQRGETLRGRKVELRKTEVEKLIDARYDIYLLEDDGNPLLIGRTAMQLTADLLHCSGAGNTPSRTGSSICGFLTWSRSRCLRVNQSRLLSPGEVVESGWV